MRKIMLISCALIFFHNAKSQITKANWMIGGNANFLFTSNKTETGTTETSNINLLPNLGYFFIDKFAVGFRVGYYRQYSKFGPPNNNFSKFTTYTIGPYVRYYLLPEENRYNILVEGSYQFGKEKVEVDNNSNPGASTNKIMIALGPVIYFNSSVGIEFLVNYLSSGNSVDIHRSKSFGAGIGLQVHLQKSSD